MSTLKSTDKSCRLPTFSSPNKHITSQRKLSNRVRSQREIYPSSRSGICRSYVNMIPPKKVGWMFLPWSKTMMSASGEKFLQVQAFESTQEGYKRSQVPKFQSSSDQNVRFKSSGAQALIATSGLDRFAKVARLKYPQLKCPRHRARTPSTPEQASRHRPQPRAH